MEKTIVFYTLAVCVFFFHFYFNLIQRKKVHQIYLLIIILFFVGSAKTLFFHHVYPEKESLKMTFPLGLLFGPFLYFCLRMIDDDFSLIKSHLLWHSFPFLIALLPFFFLFFKGELDPDYNTGYHLTLYIFIFISCFMYAVKAYEKLLGYKKIAQDSVIILSAFIVLLIIYCAYVCTIVYFAYFKNEVFSNEMLLKVTLVLRMIASSFLLLSILKIFLNTYSSFEDESPQKEKGTGFLYPIHNEKYKKAKIPAEALIVYLNDFEDFLLNKRFFLQPNLSLDFIAHTLKIPPHHLTQMISRCYNMNLVELLNHLKINYACELMEKNNNMSIPELAFLSGFSSEATFYRNFKVVKKMTTSEYRKTIKQ